jgi:hypothetical protein
METMVMITIALVGIITIVMKRTLGAMKAIVKSASR